jgi:predicted component of type VI protein secretion system
VPNQPPAESAPGSALEIEVVGGLKAGSKLLVTEELVIGRQTGGEGQFPDAEMSRRHARIARDAGGDYVIEDLGSSNGTAVNGLRIASPTLLSAGDSIELGGTALVVRSLPAPAPAAVRAAAPASARERQGAAAAPSSAQGGPDRAGGGAETPAAPPSLAVRLEVDFEAGTATVALDEGGDVVTMTFIDGHWRAASERPALSAERG